MTHRLSLNRTGTSNSEFLQIEYGGFERCIKHSKTAVSQQRFNFPIANQSGAMTQSQTRTESLFEVSIF